ncbi:hypothetical protein ACFSBZ_15755 [Amnibacterium flavum]|uniref:Uncharacterized protein n=1 Tax=Amnibacterium flavum TaxID=2173173 RepID=A0A2V1HXT4_9MICO|nr:hypothetical protein [Amnibacterium flavum]PVZ96160.1 hypothetical protein DDQ50_06945 [Amnibacterium flavum]
MTETHDEKTLEAKDVAYSPASETETERKQESGTTSEATADSDVDSDDVNVLPGTGGPDDVGDVDVDPSDVSLDGKPFPGHA